MSQCIRAQIGTKKMEIFQWIVTSLSSENHEVNSHPLCWRDKSKCAVCHLLTLRMWPLYSSSSCTLSALLTSLPLLSLLRGWGLPQRSQTSGAQRWGEAALPCPQAVLLPCPEGTPAASVNTVSEWRQASSELYKHRTAASCNSSSTKSFFSSPIQLFSLNQFWRSYIKELFHALICTLLFVSDFLPDKWFARTENSHFLL